MKKKNTKRLEVLGEYLLKNQQVTCDVNGCSNLRARTARYCHTHQYKHKQYGSPYHQRIPARLFNIHKERVLKVLLKNLTHDGIKSALELIDSWLSKEDQSVPYSQRFRDLQNTSPLEILVAISALTHIYRTTDDLIKDERHYQFHLGNVALNTKKVGVGTSKLRGKERRDVGKYLKDSLGLLLIGISEAVLERERKVKQQYHAFMKPLKG